MRKRKTEIKVKINKQNIEMQLDTGSEGSKITETVWKHIGAPKLLPRKLLRAYGGAEIRNRGECVCEITLNGITSWLR